MILSVVAVSKRELLTIEVGGLTSGVRTSGRVEILGDEMALVINYYTIWRLIIDEHLHAGPSLRYMGGSESFIPTGYGYRRAHKGWRMEGRML